MLFADTHASNILSHASFRNNSPEFNYKGLLVDFEWEKLALLIPAYSTLEI